MSQEQTNDWYGKLVKEDRSGRLQIVLEAAILALCLSLPALVGFWLGGGF